MSAQGKATRLARHYLRQLAERTGAKWTSSEDMEIAMLVHHIIVAARRETAWLRCTDQINGSGTYPVNLAHVVYCERRDGLWHAVDSLGKTHDVASEDDGVVEALMGAAEVAET